MRARHSVHPPRPGRPRRPGRGLWRAISPGPDEVGWRTVVAAVLSGSIVAGAGAALLSGLADPLLPEVVLTASSTATPVAGPEPLGVPPVVLVGWLLVVAGATCPALWLGARLVEALVALESARATERRLGRDLAAQDHQLARLAERLAEAAQARARSAEEIARAQWAVDQARTDLDHARDELRQLRQGLDVARLDLAAALGSRDDALAAAEEATRRAQASAEVARQAEQALAILALRHGEAESAEATGEDPAAGTDRAGQDGSGSPADGPVVPAWVRDPSEARTEERLVGFSSVDLRVFDAFAEADLDDVAAALDAPSRKGRHTARPTLDPAAGPATADQPDTAATGAGPAGTRAAEPPVAAPDEDGREVA